MKKYFGILPALAGAVLLAGMSFQALAADKPAAVPPVARFMQDSEECKEVASRPDNADAPPATDVRTSTYLNCMTARGYTEEDVKTRTRDSSIDFNSKPAPAPSMAPPGIPAAK